jgi:hypothetical protein
MVHLPGGDVREAPLSERSFLAGKTETEFRFRNHPLGHSDVIHHDFGDASPLYLSAEGLYSLAILTTFNDCDI